MSKKSNLTVLIIGLVVVIFIAVIAIVLALNYVKNTVVNDNEITLNNIDVSDKESLAELTTDWGKYHDVTNGWSVMIPDDWREVTENLDLVGFTPVAEPMEIGVARGIEVLYPEATTIAELEEQFRQNYDGAEITSILIDGVPATQLDGIIREDEGNEEMGRQIVKTVLSIPDGPFMALVLYNSKQLPAYQAMINTIKFDASVVLDENSPNIIVDSPTGDEPVSSPIHLSGQARVFEGTVNYILFDVDDNMIVEGFTTTEAAEVGEFGAYSIDIDFITAAKTGYLEVFQYSAKDGSKEDSTAVYLDFS